MEQLTWTCHVCGKERPNEFISVASAPLADLPGASINIRYCSNNILCEIEARECASRGEFPKREKIISKKWWEFWK